MTYILVKHKSGAYRIEAVHDSQPFWENRAMFEDIYRQFNMLEITQFVEAESAEKAMQLANSREGGELKDD